MQNDEQFRKELLRKLDLITALLLGGASGDERSVAEKARRLSDLGLAPAEIGRILGKKANYISAVLGSKRKTR